MTDYQEITLTTENKISTITLNRPDKLNAWTAQMAEEVRDAVIYCGNDKNTRCIIITGAGRGFCAGADMGGLQSTASAGNNAGAAANPEAVPFNNAPGPDIGAEYTGRFGYLYTCPKPVIAAINGPCAGIGLILTLYADLRFATDSAKFTTAFAARGLIAEHGIAWLLPRLVGEANALDLLLSARKFTGDEAAEMGLVNRVLPGEELLQYVNTVASTLASDVSPRSMAIMKRQIRASYSQSFNESLAVADAEMAQSFSTFDFKEGVDSFVERRSPLFNDI